MAVAEVAAPAATSSVEAEEGARPSGLAGLLGTGDHIAVGRLFVLASVLFLLVAAVSGSLVALEDIDTGSSIFDSAIGQLASAQLTGAVFLFLIPAFLGVAIAVVPLQVGAGTVAFPRAATAAFWGWFLSGAVLLAAYTIDGGPIGVDVDGQLLWLVGLGGVLVSLTLASVCVLTTLWALRTAGMGLDRVPYFAWSMLVAASVWLLTLPVLFGLVVLAYIQVRYGAPVGAAVAFNRLGLAFGSPAAFAWAVPLLGVLLDATGAATRSRLRLHGVLLGALAAFGVLTFPGDMLVAFEDPASGIFQDFLYVVGSWAAVLPLLALAGGVATAMGRGRPRVTAPLVLALASFLVLLLAGAANAVRVVDALDLTGTPTDSGVAHLAWTAGVLGVVAALHQWSTKIFGVVMKAALGYLAGVVLLVGGAVTGLARVVIGFLDAGDSAIDALNTVAFVGWVLFVLGLLIVLVDLAGSAAASRSGPAAPDDPWDGTTLEWLTSSPPVPGRRGPLDPVTSATPLLDIKERETVST